MKKLISSLVIVFVFTAGFVFASVVGFKDVAEAANNIWKTLGNVIFNQDLEKSVGIGTKTPSEKLSVTGKIESTNGGFKFPDGSVQATAGDKNLHLYDANGQDLGVLMDQELLSPLLLSRKYMVLLGNSQKIEVTETPAGYKAKDPGTGYDHYDATLSVWYGNMLRGIFYTELNCTGNKYINLNDADPSNAYYEYDFAIPKKSDLFRDNYGNFYSLETGDVETTNFFSYDVGSGCRNIDPNGTLQDYFGVFKLKDIVAPFTEPLAYPLSIR